MKKLCAIFLAALMLLTVLPMAAFARVANNDRIMTEILTNGNYEHINYTHEKEYFKTGLIVNAVFHAEDWGSQIKGDTYEAKAAKTVLLALIDKIEAELNNETFEKILSVLKGASTAAGLVEKVNDLTGKLDFVTSSEWATSLTVLNNAIKVMNFANDEYEKYAEGYAIILSCQAASSYYAGLLDYIATHVADDNIADAAIELKEYITMDLDEANRLLMQQIKDDAGQEGALIAIDLAMNTNTVTAAIKTAYGLVGSIGDKLFNSTDIATYKAALAAVTYIEDIIVPYITAEIENTDVLAADFARVAMISLRESGEKALSNLGKVTADSIYGKIFKKDDAAEMAKRGAIAVAKLGVYKDIILADADYTVNDVRVITEVKKNATVYNANGEAVAVLKNGKESAKITDDGAFYSVFDSVVGTYIKVIVTFGEGYEVKLSTASDSSSSSSSGKKSGGFFANFFKAISDFFASLFSIFKK